MLNFFARSGRKIEKIDSLCVQGEGKRHGGCGLFCKRRDARVRAVATSKLQGAHDVRQRSASLEKSFFGAHDLITSIMRTTKVTSLSLPPKLLREMERLARREGRTRSELLREALRRYVADSRWRELQEFGRSQARKLGIEESHIERFVEEYRSER